MSNRWWWRLSIFFVAFWEKMNCKHLLIHKMFCDKKFFYNKNIHHSIVRRNVMLKCSCIKKKCYFRIFFTPLWNLNWDAFSCLHHLLYHYSVEHSGIIVLFFFPLIFQFYLFIDFAHTKNITIWVENYSKKVSSTSSQYGKIYVNVLLQCVSYNFSFIV